MTEFRGDAYLRRSQRMPRRGFLKIATRAIIGALAGQQAYSYEQRAALASKHGIDSAKHHTQTTVERVRSLFPGQDKPPEQAPPQQTESMVTTQEVHSSPHVSEEFKKVFPNLTDEETVRVLETIRPIKAKTLGQLDNKTISDVNKWENLIRGSARQNEVPDKLLLGLAAWESKGNPKAVPFDAKSDSDAAGLFMVTVETGRNIGLTINDTIDERLIPEKVTPAVAAEIRKEFDKFGDWGMAFWSHQLGDTQLLEALQLFLRVKYNQEMPDISTLPQVIKDKRISVFHVLDNPTLQEYFTGPRWDKTDQFLYLVLTTQEAYFEEKEKLGL